MIITWSLDVRRHDHFLKIVVKLPTTIRLDRLGSAEPELYIRPTSGLALGLGLNHRSFPDWDHIVHKDLRLINIIIWARSWWLNDRVPIIKDRCFGFIAQEIHCHWSLGLSPNPTWSKCKLKVGTWNGTIVQWGTWNGTISSSGVLWRQQIFCEPSPILLVL